MESNFKDIRELTRALQMGSRLLSDMFSKRKTLRTIRYDDALEVLDGDEVKLRSLITHGIIIDNDGALELDDVYLEFFENVLEVNEDVNVASVQAYIGKLRLKSTPIWPPTPTTVGRSSCARYATSSAALRR